MQEYEIPEYDAQVLTSSKALANFFEECIRGYRSPKAISNWIMGDLLRELKLSGIDIDESPIRPVHMSKMIKMIDEGVISGKIAKTVFEEMYKTGTEPETIVKEKGLVQVTDEGEIERYVSQVIAENPKEVEAYRGGKDKLIGFFVGQVMKLSGGKANPAKVNEILGLLRGKLSRMVKTPLNPTFSEDREKNQ